MMIIGFTGSRYGMSQHQQAALIDLLAVSLPDEAHHGMCIGADAQFHELIRKLYPKCRIIGHPPVNESRMAKIKCDALWQPDNYLTRDRHIVHQVGALIATPSTFNPTPYSGTWYTVQYALSLDIPVYVIKPDGNVT